MKKAKQHKLLGLISIHPAIHLIHKGTTLSLLLVTIYNLQQMVEFTA